VGRRGNAKSYLRFWGQMSQVKINARERRQLKALTHEVFARLVVDRETDNVNDVQDFTLTSGLILIVMICVSASIWAVQKFDLASKVEKAFPELEGFGLAATILLPLFAFGILAMLLRPTFSKTSFNTIGRWIVRARRLRPGSVVASSSLDDIHYWMRSDGNRAAVEVLACTGTKCVQTLPKAFSNALVAMKRAEAPKPFVIARGLLEKKYAHLYLANGLHSKRPDGRDGEETANYYQRARTLRNAIKIAIAFDVLDAELRDEAPNGHHWLREYYTKFDYQHVPFWDLYDIVVRFRTSTPHMRWPNSQKPSSDGEVPLFRAITCIENPCQLDMRIVSVRDVIGAMPDTLAEFGEEYESNEPDIVAMRREQAARAICLLANSPVSVFGKRDEYTLQPQMGREAVDEALIRRLDGKTANADDMDVEEILEADWGIRWDPNRVILSKLNPSSDSKLMRAIALLMQAISNTMRNKSESLILSRGDAVFIDNLRSLVGRFEPNFAKIAWWKRTLGFPAEWWLQGFYGFRRAQYDASDKEHLRARFDQNDIHNY
jgi:hypothetical protein